MAWKSTISQPGLTAAAVVSASNGTRRVVGASVCNPTVGAQTLTLYLVKSGDAVAADVVLYSGLSVGADATAILNAALNIGLADGDEIHALASAATSLTLTMSVVDA